MQSSACSERRHSIQVLSGVSSQQSAALITMYDGRLSLVPSVERCLLGKHIIIVCVMVFKNKNKCSEKKINKKINKNKCSRWGTGKSLQVDIAK